VTVVWKCEEKNGIMKEGNKGKKGEMKKDRN
jgi:hypothetical protein